MTTMPSTTPAEHERFVQLSPEEFRRRISEALSVYVSAMNYPPGTAEHRAPRWLAHVLCTGWRCFAVLGTNDELIGLAYGYRGRPDQWWHTQVHRGLVAKSGEHAAAHWLDDYFELAEIHVRPDHHSRGLGETLLRKLVAGIDYRHVLLSTPEGPTKAWKLYRKLGFDEVLRDHRFTGDPRPFAILGRTLPLEA